MLGDEQCDDGNLLNGDGCSSACRIEPSYYCTTTSGGTSTCAVAVCGDGARQGEVATEACDDGNTNNLDGCNSTCGFETGFLCTNPYPATAQTVCDACGNGYFLVGTEACDDNNTATGDGCSDICTVEATYTCTTPAVSGVFSSNCTA